MIGIDPEAPATLYSDLAAFADRKDAARLRALLPQPAAALAATDRGSELEDRVRDHLREASVAAAFEVARSAAAGPPGEPYRRRLRAVGREFLAWAAREPASEVGERLRRGSPEGGFEVALATEIAAADRQDLLRRWGRLEGELEAVRLEWSRARATAAARSGASSVGALLAASEPTDVGEIAARFERVAIRPLDGPIHDAVRELAGPADETLDPGSLALSRGRIASCVDSLARELRSEVRCRADGSTSALEAWSEMRIEATGRPALVLGALAGPIALVRCLGTLGRAIRAEFQRPRQESSARWVDPGFVFATETVFRRLALTGRALFPGLGSDAFARALRLDLALAPRAAWAYLFLAVEQAKRGESFFERRGAEVVLERALGREALPGERSLCFAADPAGAAELRGIVLGLLFEERLLTRYGRNWPEQKAALRALQECWEAEPFETVESMAAASGLGTIEPVTILDRCRP